MSTLRCVGHAHRLAALTWIAAWLAFCPGTTAAQPGSCGATVSGLLPGHHFYIQNNATHEQQEVKDNGWVELCQLVNGTALSIGEQPLGQVCKASGDLRTAGQQSALELKIKCGKPVAAYVVDRGDGSVAQYRVNTVSGDWTPLQPQKVAAGLQPIAIAVAPDQRNAYVLNYASRSISQYAVNQETAALEPLPQSQVAAWFERAEEFPSYPTSMAMSADGAKLYVLQSVIDPTLGSSGLANDIVLLKYYMLENLVLSFERQPDGRLLPLRGSLENSRVVAEGVLSLASHPQENSYLYEVESNAGSLTSFDTARHQGQPFRPDAITSESTAEFPLRTGELPISASFNHDGDWLYTVDFKGNTITHFAINPFTGGLAPQGQLISTYSPQLHRLITYRLPLKFETGPNPFALALTSDDRFAYVLEQRRGMVQGYGVDAQSGRLQKLDVVGSHVHLGALPNALIAAPFGNFLYAVLPESRSVHRMHIDPLSGGIDEVIDNMLDGALVKPQAIGFAAPFGVN